MAFKQQANHGVISGIRRLLQRSCHAAKTRGMCRGTRAMSRATVSSRAPRLRNATPQSSAVCAPRRISRSPPSAPCSNNARTFFPGRPYSPHQRGRAFFIVKLHVRVPAPQQLRFTAPASPYRAAYISGVAPPMPRPFTCSLAPEPPSNLRSVSVSPCRSRFPSTARPLHRSAQGLLRSLQSPAIPRPDRSTVLSR